MARRQQKRLVEPTTLAGLFLTLGTIWLIAQLLHNLPSGTVSAFAWVILAAATAAMVYPVIRLLRRAGARQALLLKARDACDAHLASLIRRRAQLVQPDAYGKPQFEKREKEVRYFISGHIRPLLTPSEEAALQRNYHEVVAIIRARIKSATRDQPAFQIFSENMTPAEFEVFCAEELRRAGWDARVTMHSRDQGVDVVAQKNGRRAVL